MSYISKSVVQFGDSVSIDPFGRARVSTPFTVFDSKQLYDNVPLIFDDAQTSGSGTNSTYSSNLVSTTISVSNATAGTRVRQSKRRLNYQPGKGQLIFVTFTAVTNPGGVTKRVGYFDESNGIYLKMTNGVVYVGRRSSTSGSPVDTEIAQSSWNIDKLDGTGISGKTLDITKSQIFMVDMEWLGVGRVRCAIVINGIPYYFHEFVHSNINSNVYMNNPNLPIRYEISNDGTGAASTLECICSSVMSEGGVQENGMIFGIDRGATVFATNNDSNIYPLLGIRLKSTHLSATARVHSFSVVCTTTSAFRWALLLNPTVTGTALTFSSVTNSSIDACTTSTNGTTLSGGTVLYTGYANQVTSGDLNITVPISIYLGSTIAGVPDTIYLGIQRISTSAESFLSAMNWIEG